ncbi:MAG: hypothetical protein JKZ03_03310 [Flavobacteriaceae bacterium]|nr:hypothetical protein [Flavobacteriaceae bacterium]
MAKKYINKRKVKRTVSEQLLNGKSKSEILTELEDIYYEKDILIKIIVGTPSPEIRKKLNLLNTVLGIAAIAIVIFRFQVFGIDYVGSGLTLLTLILGISVFSYEALSYRLISLLCLITLIRYFMNYEANIFLLVDFGLTVVIITLGLYLGTKLFPNYGVLGPKKDNDGKPIID